MFCSKALLSLLFIVLSVVQASPVDRSTGKATLRFTTRINGGGTLNIAEKDRARNQAMRESARLGKRDASFSVTNNGVTYTADVGIGEPATSYTLLIDTGSSNTFVGAGKGYVQTSSSQDTGNSAGVSYGSGSWSGEEWIDTVTLSPDLVIHGQSIGVAGSSQGFNNVDGILGVGPTDLTSGTVANTGTVPTVTDNLYTQGTISSAVLGAYYVPAAESDSHGQLDFGGNAIRGSVDYFPLTQTSPANTFWGIDGSITYGGQTVLSSTAGIVDTGTTLFLIATNAFQTYQSMTGGTLDSATGLLKITSDQYANLATLTFNTGSKAYDLTPNAQIWPRSLNANIGGDPNSIYLVVGDSGQNSGSGLDFTLGYTFLERYYSVFDTTNSQIGFATTDYTGSTSN